MRRRRRLLSRISTVLLVLAAVGWLLFLRPEPLGGSTTYVIVSGVSMEPTLNDGDFVIARGQSDYEIGDIVVYAVPEGDVGAGARIIHRIIDEEDDGFVIQGDNPDIKVPDIWRPTASEIEGKLWVVIPAVGRYLPLLRSPLVLALLAGAFVFWVMYPAKEDAYAPDEARSPEPTDAEVAAGPDEEDASITIPEPLVAPLPAYELQETATSYERQVPMSQEPKGRDGRKLLLVGFGFGAAVIVIVRYLRSR